MKKKSSSKGSGARLTLQAYDSQAEADQVGTETAEYIGLTCSVKYVGDIGRD